MASKHRVKIFLDSAQTGEVAARYLTVDGFTTNPTLIRQAGHTNYAEFLAWYLRYAVDKPVSVEVVADDLTEMDQQARWIAAQGLHVYVKIPITNTQGVSTLPLIRDLIHDGIKVNVTAVMTNQQAEQAIHTLATNRRTLSILSVFAGRIADTGRNPVSAIRWAKFCAEGTNTQILWASPREVYNVTQAADCGCDIITLTPALLDKLSLMGKDLSQYSLETVQMFRNDALEAGLTIPTPAPVPIPTTAPF